jgi:TPP-dependent indolepyruvate ferredoxin oxidoreductase alpha subunit
MEAGMAQGTLTLGVEAVGCATFDAGIKGAFRYPGTPSTEGFEYVEAMIHTEPEDRVARRAANEKAMESALLHPGPSVVIFRRECIQSLHRGVLKDHGREEEALLEQACCTTEVRP